MFDFNNDFKPQIRVKRIPADRISPAAVLEKLKPTALLESACHETGNGKYSLLILKEAFSIIKDKDEYYLKTPARKKFHISTPLGSYLEILGEFRSRAPDPSILNGLPTPFGGIGYFAYEFIDEHLSVDFQKTDERKLYESAFIFGRTFIIFNHVHNEAVIISVNYENETEPADLDKEILDAETRLDNMIRDGFSSNIPEEINGEILVEGDEKRFLKSAGLIKKEIEKNNLIQCALSSRMELRTGSNPHELYRNLRLHRPSPYMFFLNCRLFTIIGASPVMMVKVKNNIIRANPLSVLPAGNTVRDEDDISSLNINEKTGGRAKHLTLIDVERNDLARISGGGSIKLSEKMSIKKHAHRMVMVSRLESILEKGYAVNDVISAVLPAAGVSGAPKLNAVKMIEKLEKERRGPFAGVVGYFEKDGSFDSCVAVDTVICKKERIWLQALTTITYDSVPGEKYRDTQQKISSLLAAFNIKI